MKNKEEIFFSVDIEADGKIPYRNSMLSLGCAAYTIDRKLIGTFEANLEEFPGAKGDEATMDWWKTQPQAWEACRKDLQNPKDAMEKFVSWVESFDCLPVFVAFPAGFDFMFVKWYCEWFVNRCPFQFQALDIKSYAMAVLKIPFRKSTKRNFPKNWFPKLPHTHVALDDAKEQGLLFLNMLEQNQKK